MATTQYDEEDMIDLLRGLAKHGNRFGMEQLELDAEYLAQPMRLQTVGTIAAASGNDDILQFLFEKGVDLLCNVQVSESRWTRTPLFEAVCNNKQSTVLLLLTMGADPGRREVDVNSNPIHQAILKGNKPLLEIMWTFNAAFIQPRLPSGALAVVEAMLLESSQPTEGSLFYYVLHKFEARQLDFKDTRGFAAVHHLCFPARRASTLVL